MLDAMSLDYARGGGFVTVVAQDADTGAVLMVARADAVAMARSLETGEMHYSSRRRGLWHKGASSGNVQSIVSLTADCDRDTVLARVRPAGPACHSGSRTCFGNDAGADALSSLDSIIADRMASADLEAGYTRQLARDRNLRLKKLGEESAELVTALADGDASRALAEGADVIFHVLVALRAAGVTLDDLRHELARRGEPAPRSPA
ncbi:MAG TPA: phosphoribosyl-ATP diphosphatase [Gemmatimonadaceae bacterium]|nr:phosphoribosyl-ATP diphosphatase [Gemmatimonadaceae bacterium]